MELSMNKLCREGPMWLNASIHETALPDEVPDDGIKELKASGQ